MDDIALQQRHCSLKGKGTIYFIIIKYMYVISYAFIINYIQIYTILYYIVESYYNINSLISLFVDRLSLSVALSHTHFTRTHHSNLYENSGNLQDPRRGLMPTLTSESSSSSCVAQSER